MRKIPIKSLAPYLRKLGAGAQRAFHTGLQAGGQHVVAEMQRRTAAAGVFNLGGYRRGWKFSIQDGALWVFNDAPYSGVIEEGRRRGARMPPPDVIMKWARRKLMLSPKEAKAAAFPLARAISEKGIKGKHLLRAAMPTLTQMVLTDVTAALKRAIKQSKP